MSRRARGIAQMIASGVCFGFLGFFGKSVYALGVTPHELLSLRFLIGGLTLVALLAFIKPRVLLVDRRTALVCAGLGALGYAVFSSCFFLALRGLSSSLTVLLLYAYPAIVAVGAFWLFDERIPRSRLVALPLTLLGLALLVWGDIAINDRTALVFGIGSAVFYSGYILASRRYLRGVDPIVAGAYIMLSAGLTLALIHWRDPERIIHVVRVAWPTLLAVAWICSLLAMTLFLAGLRHLASWEASLWSTTEPITAIAVAVMLLGERLALVQVAGAVVVLSMFALLSLPARAPNISD